MRFNRLLHPIFILSLLLTMTLACSDNDNNDVSTAARLEAPSVGAVNTPVTFNASGSQGAVRYDFDFGDGERKQADTPFAFHKYTRSGEFTVTLMIEDSKGTTAKAVQTIQVLDPDDEKLVFRVPVETMVPKLWEIPFPNDLYLGEDGHVKVDAGDLTSEFSPNGASVLSKGLNVLSGFGLSTAVYFNLPRPPLAASLPETREASVQQGSTVCLINIDKNSKEYGKRQPVVCSYDSTMNRLAVLPVPGIPLKPATRYAAVLTTGLVSEKGPYQPSDDFRALLSNTAVTNESAALYQPLWDYLNGTEDMAERGVISAATVFTTQNTLEDLPNIRIYLKSIPPAQPDFKTAVHSRIYDTPEKLAGLFGAPGEDLPLAPDPNCPRKYDHLATIAMGTFPALDFRDPTTGVFSFDGNGNPIAQATKNQIPFVIAIPNTPPPASGYPILIAQHGIGDSREIVANIADAMAAAGFVTVGIDAVEHGYRYGGAKDVVNNFTGVPGPDGFADYDPNSKIFGFLKSFMSFGAIRGNLRQTTADHLQLLSMIQNESLDLSAIGNPMLDRDHIYLLGNSLGTFMGLTFLAVEPTFKAAVFTVGGGGLFTTFINSPKQFGGNEATLKLLFGIPADYIFDQYSLMVNLGQAVFDGGDCINYASWLYKDIRTIDGVLRSPPDLLQIEALGDDNVPNISNETLARALGIELLEPYLSTVDGIVSTPSPAYLNISTEAGKATGALAQYSPAAHWELLYCDTGTLYFVPGFPYPNGTSDERFPKLPEPIVIDMPGDEVHEQIAHFFQSKIEKGHAEIISTHTPVADFDGDGVEDHVDNAPYDPKSH